MKSIRTAIRWACLWTVVPFLACACVAMPAAAPPPAPTPLDVVPTRASTPTAIKPLAPPGLAGPSPAFTRTDSPDTLRTPVLTLGRASPAPTAESNYRVEISVFDRSGRTAITGVPGTPITLTVAFRPYKDVITGSSGGTPVKYSTTWSPNNLADMRYCTGVGRACALPERWQPFSGEQRVAVSIDWIGTRDWTVTAQFRDSAGKIVPAGIARTDQASYSIPLTGAFDARTPVGGLPPAAQTLWAQQNAAFPVTGQVTVGPGHPVGGKAGSVVQIDVRFQATGPSGAVTEMRIKRDTIGRCLTPEEMAGADWEPFVTSRSYSYSVAVNWTTFKLHVQYRDAQGNLSPVYCGDVAVEGSP